MKIFVVGHKSPDLDATAAPVAYSEYLTATKRYDAEVIPTVIDGINKETEFVFGKYNIKLPKKISSTDVSTEDRIILVDHNEEDQRGDGLNKDQIIEIVDHHKIKVDFGHPIRLEIKPYGSVSSLIYENFVKDGVKPSKAAASLMLCSILSDTQGLKSSTTTDWDKRAVNELTARVGESIEKLTFELFKAKSDITGMNTEQIVKKDYKVFDFSGTKVFIGQVETVEPEKIAEMKKQVLDAMKKVKETEKVEHLVLVVTDILKVNSVALYNTKDEQELLEKAFNNRGKDNIIEIGPRMSRKKDIAPPIEAVLTK